MNRIFLSTVFFVVFFLCSDVNGADDGFLPGFDAEARGYIRKERTKLVEGLKEDKRGDAWVRSKMSLMLHFLMPFCSDLRTYEEQCSQQRKHEYGYYGTVRMARILRPEWMPTDWPGAEVHEKDVIRRRAGLSDYHNYLRVPDTIFPIFTWPGKSPTLFDAAIIRKGRFSCTWLNSWLDVIIVLHEDDGFGIANPTEEQLLKIRDLYFRLPPEDLTLPNGWSSVFVVDRREGRFCMGRMVSLVDGKKPKTAGPAEGRITWLNTASFFYDGNNFAFRLTGWSNGMANESPEVAPADVDWEKEFPNK